MFRNLNKKDLVCTTLYNTYLYALYNGVELRIFSVHCGRHFTEEGTQTLLTSKNIFLGGDFFCFYYFYLFCWLLVIQSDQLFGQNHGNVTEKCEKSVYVISCWSLQLCCPLSNSCRV